MIDRVQLAIILPCYNPSPDWTDNVAASMKLLDEMLNGVTKSITIVNDGSKTWNEEDDDRIKELASQIDGVKGAHVIHYDENRGKGFALRTGIGISEAEVYIYTDIDFPFEEASIVDTYHMLAQEKADVVAGVRDQDYYTKVPAFRLFVSKVLKWMIRNMLSIQITDTQTGLKGFNEKGKAKFLATRTDRYLFDLEFIMSSSKDKEMKLKSVPVKLKPQVVFSRVNLQILMQEALNFIQLLIRG